ncbi:hypothetical protein Cantr_01247 [Candida viswanathii]|uniref:Uncharacterized protein n=1 Tax=Candida viswanathii TaxID=5486 RepID=A0A367YHW2_9ASCO|nr:hypothetical protein Cantr_01247 [Candida viswanathii]
MRVIDREVRVRECAFVVGIGGEYPCVLVFDVNDDFSMVEYKQTVLAPGSIVDFTLAGSTIVASVESEDPVKFFSLQDDGKLRKLKG